MDPLIALAVAIGFVAGLLAVALFNWIWPKEQPPKQPNRWDLLETCHSQQRTIARLKREITMLHEQFTR